MGMMERLNEGGMGMGSAKDKQLLYVKIENLKLSRFNTRRTRPADHIKHLAERIRRNGFEPTRALWVYEGDDGCFEVFAGGTRLEAARVAGLEDVPVFDHLGFSDDDFARLADEDNENDEYHAEVPKPDIWAEYHRLALDEKWTQRRIAQAKNVDRTLVNRRIGWHTSLPQVARKAVCDGILGEDHLVAISGAVCDVTHLEPWLTTEQAQTELIDEVLGKHRGASEGIKPTVKLVREAAVKWKAMITLAQNTYYHELTRDDGRDWKAVFVEELCRLNARTQAAILQAKENTLRLKQAEAEGRRQKADKDAQEAKQKAERLTFVNSLVARVQKGDARQLIQKAPSGFHLLLTDPPYGIEYQSGRRKASPKKAPIASDELTSAIELLIEVLRKAHGKMTDNSTVLVFSSWRNEPPFREAIKAAGFEIRGSLVWVKNNHGTGDLTGAFAPKHERIIHAVKGNPKLTQRHPDVLSGKDKQDSEHPAEKPRDLLGLLIEATTEPGQIVVDPFAGSGNVLFEAYARERDFFGCEIEEHWHRQIVDRFVSLAQQEEKAA